MRWGENGISEGKTGNIHFNLAKLQLIDPTDSFQNQKGTRLVSPHVTDVKAHVSSTSAQSSVAVEDKASSDSTHNPVEILFQLAAQSEDTEAQGAHMDWTCQKLLARRTLRSIFAP